MTYVINFDTYYKTGNHWIVLYRHWSIVPFLYSVVAKGIPGDIQNNIGDWHSLSKTDILFIMTELFWGVFYRTFEVTFWVEGAVPTRYVPHLCLIFMMQWLLLLPNFVQLSLNPVPVHIQFLIISRRLLEVYHIENSR